MRPRLLSHTSTSISGREERPGFRKRSKMRPYSSGSKSVMRMAQAVREPPAEPRPGPTGMPLSLAQVTNSCTTRK